MIRRSIALVSLFALVLTATAFSLTQSTTDALDPVRVAPDTHKVAFENVFVRVLEVLTTRKHRPRHRHPHGLSVYLSDWQVKSRWMAWNRSSTRGKPERSPGARRSFIQCRTSDR